MVLSLKKVISQNHKPNKTTVLSISVPLSDSWYSVEVITQQVYKFLTQGR